MITSFKDRGTEDIYHGNRSKKAREILPQELHQSARRKLDMIDAADRLEDLRVPPGNQLELLKGNLIGMHSIRINSQWRVIFKWAREGVEDVQILDYHR